MNIAAEMFSIENHVEALKEEIENSENDNKTLLRSELKFQKKEYSKLKSRLRQIAALNPTTT
jgi:predicted RNase H-like nuclease (RuvC/YqgF family)